MQPSPTVPWARTGRTLRWRHNGQDTVWSAADAEGAARQLADLAAASTP